LGRGYENVFVDGFAAVCSDDELELRYIVVSLSAFL